MKKKEPIIYENFALIPLTKGYFAKVDLEDLHLVENYNWIVVEGKNVNYARTIYKVNGKSKGFYMHKFILNEYEKIVDHINLNGLDNRKNNLRKVEYSQNSQNSKHRINNSSGHKGVTWNKNAGKWLVQIGYKRKRLHVGYFDDIEEARNAYYEASKKYHKEYGRLH